ncbi:ubiquitin-specific protease ubp2 [Coemansia sp. RSA 1722]|nr:ubiquitin-specific protease ubp2 [Coemansia sp. RSA 486]KAJ2232596.1 ubiquitin-specific protease ubp2 [Coemansia sp. RSA 485]KAJ2596258.1 ubiquitin-specific protease ubp2 [Coemansia sp. RSA 1722]
MAIGSVDKLHNMPGVLGGYFAKVQLSSWVPSDLTSQLSHDHKHSWVHKKTAETTSSEGSAGSRLWQAHCRDCLCRLELVVSVDACTVQNECVDKEGHHIHAHLAKESETSSDQTLGPEAACHGRARCCKCGFTVDVKLQPPIIEPSMFRALENARMMVHQHHPTQGVRDYVATTKSLCTLSRNAAKGERRSTKTTNEKARSLLKFDAPCNHILEILGFELVGDEFHPPVTGDPKRPTLVLRRLQRASEELSIMTGRAQRRLPEQERLPNHAIVPATDSLVSMLGSSAYARITSALSLSLAFVNSSKDSKLDSAYRTLGAPEDAADSLISWAYTRLADEDTSEEPLTGPSAQKRFDAISAISAARGSDELQTLVEAEKMRGMVTTESARLACRAVFGDSVELDDVDSGVIREVFLVRLAEVSSQKTKIELANHLSVLACAKRDQSLCEYAADVKATVEQTPEAQEKPKIDTWLQLPVGLNNIGNTCYLNCMLQCLFSIAPIRHAVMRYGDGVTWNESLALGRRDSGRALTEFEIQQALRFVLLLKQLFESLVSRRLEGWSTLVEKQGGDAASGGGSHPLANIHAPLSVSPDRELADMLLRFGDGANDSRALNQQQDVDECMAQCVSLLVHALPPSANSEEREQEQKDNGEDGAWIHNLLAGHLEMSTMATKSNKASEGDKDDKEKPTEDTFLNLNLNIPTQTTDINDCISAFFEPSVISSDSMSVDGSEPNDITRYTRIRDAPPVLCMQIQRVQFDMTTMKAFKINSHLRLRRQVSLTPFTEFGGSSDAATNKRRELQTQISRLDKNLQTLQVPVPMDEGGPVSVLSALGRLRAFSQGVSRWTEMEAAKPLLADLPQSAADIAHSAQLINEQLQPMCESLTAAKNEWEKGKVDLKKQLDRVYDDIPQDSMAYTLHAVFIHSGSTPEFGHYWVYIRDYNWQKGEERWLKFNDAVVSVVSVDEVLSDLPNATEEFSNPYYLVYVRSQDIDKTVDMSI